MTWVDYVALAVVGVSLGLGLWRGFVRETLSLAGWVAATAAALLWAADAARLMSFATPTVRTMIAFIAIFVLVLLVSSVAGMLLSRMFRAAGLGLADRMLGAVFGFARAALMLVAAALVVGFTPLARSADWRDAAVSGPLETAVMALKPWLPEKLAARVDYRR
jgi:membrane protein required for colicin V production